MVDERISVLRALPVAERPAMTFENVMEFRIAWGDRPVGLRNGKLLDALSKRFQNAPREYFVLLHRAMRDPVIREQYSVHIAHLEAVTAERLQLRSQRLFASRSA